ncbi:hypothetical protein, partial [Limnohabitans sp.]|uniref:hypothetical protein n=1 Tax=Limnohabitans sp. TaxID=1907725 RepID=UPI002FDDCC56
AASFLNTGTLTLGDSASDVLSFDSGLVVTAPNSLSLGGTVNTNHTAITLGDNNTPLVLNNHLTLSTGNAALTLGGLVYGPHDLVLNSTGVTTLTSEVGGNGQALTSLTSNAIGSLIIQGGRITTTGAQTFNDDVLLGNAARSTTLNTTDSNVFFGGKLNNQTPTAEALLINAGTGNVTFTGAVGDLAKIAALIVNSGGVTTFVSTVDAASVTSDALGSVVIQGGRITTTGAQTFNDDVVLGNAARSTTLNTTNSNIFFGGKINNQTATAEALTI